MHITSLPALDKDGFLKNPDDWSPEVATHLAEYETIKLSEAHWEIIHLIREFYLEFGISPVNRVLVKTVAEKLGPNKGRSIYLMQLFPGSPTKLASKIAGLPKPNNCL